LALANYVIQYLLDAMDKGLVNTDLLEYGQILEKNGGKAFGSQINVMCGTKWRAELGVWIHSVFGIIEQGMYHRLPEFVVNWNSLMTQIFPAFRESLSYYRTNAEDMKELASEKELEYIAKKEASDNYMRKLYVLVPTITSDVAKKVRGHNMLVQLQLSNIAKMFSNKIYDLISKVKDIYVCDISDNWLVTDCRYDSVADAETELLALIDKIGGINPYTRSDFIGISALIINYGKGSKGLVNAAINFYRYWYEFNIVKSIVLLANIRVEKNEEISPLLEDNNNVTRVLDTNIINNKPNTSIKKSKRKENDKEKENIEKNYMVPPG